MVLACAVMTERAVMRSSYEILEISGCAETLVHYVSIPK